MRALISPSSFILALLAGAIAGVVLAVGGSSGPVAVGGAVVVFLLVAVGGSYLDKRRGSQPPR